MKRKKVTPRAVLKAAAAERRAQVIAQRRDGRTYQQIGEGMGITKQRVLQIIQRSIELGELPHG